MMIFQGAIFWCPPQDLLPCARRAARVRGAGGAAVGVPFTADFPHLQEAERSPKALTRDEVTYRFHLPQPATSLRAKNKRRAGISAEGSLCFFCRCSLHESFAKREI